MKFLPSITVYLVAVAVTLTLTFTSPANAELRGAVVLPQPRKLEEQTFAPFAPPGPDSDAQCTAIGLEPYLTEEYVAFRWNLTYSNGTDLPDDYWPLDCTNSSDRWQLEYAFVTAYADAMGQCSQKGAYHEVYWAELDDCDQIEGTYYMHIKMYSNAAKQRAAVLPDSNNCGVVVYNDTDEALDSEWDFDIVDDNDERLRRRTQEEACDCAGPRASDLIVEYNNALVSAFDNPEFVTYINETQQLCIVPEIVSLDLSSSEPTDSTSSEPTESPNRSSRPSRDNTPSPTSSEDTDSPSTKDPVADTNSPSIEDPTTDAPLAPGTDSPVAPITSPESPQTDTPVAPADAPVAPVEAPDEAPVESPEEAPVEAPEEAPVEAPVEPDDEGGDDGGGDEGGGGDDGGDQGGDGGGGDQGGDDGDQ